MKLEMKLITGEVNPKLAEEVARELRIPLEKAEIASFPDGETLVRLRTEVRDLPTFILQPTCPPVNDHLMVLALLCDAARAEGAKSITAVVPYFGYARQDQRWEGGEPRSAQVVGNLLESVGIDRLITLDLHTPTLESVFRFPVTHLYPEELFLSKIRALNLEDLVVVSPDAGGVKRAQRFQKSLNADIAVITKVRARSGEIQISKLLGEVKDRPCLVVDDMASSGKTLVRAAEALKQAGAGPLYAAFTHPVLAEDSLQRIENAPFEKIWSTDSVPPPKSSRIEFLSTAPMLAETIRDLMEVPKSFETTSRRGVLV